MVDQDDGRFDLWRDSVAAVHAQAHELAALILAHSDRLLTRHIVAASADRLIVNGWQARQLPARLAAAGLQAIGERALTSVECDPAGFYARLAERRASVAAQAGVISADEHQGWIDALHAEQAAGRFLGGQTHLFVWGTRPE